MNKYYVSVHAKGDTHWFSDPECTVYHRFDGPAMEYPNGGTKKWFVNGELHRTDGPAAELVNGTCKWYQNGVLHRTDGPAITRSDGYQSWYRHGVCYQRNVPTLNN